MWFTKRSAASPCGGKEAQGGADKLAGVLARGILWAQRAFVRYLQEKTGSLSRTRFTTALVLFCLLCGGYSTYLVAVAVIRPAKKSTPFSVEAIRTPKPAGSSPAVHRGQEDTAHLRVVGKIRAFRLLMDSFRKNRAGLYDSIHAGRQGLLDSLGRVEELYHLPKTK